jgi:hypothetical protein
LYYTRIWFNSFILSRRIYAVRIYIRREGRRFWNNLRTGTPPISACYQVIQKGADFIKKCERMAAYPRKCLVIEGSLSSLKTPYSDSLAHPNAVLRSLLAAQERWGIQVHFLGTFALAEEFVASLLSRYHACRWLEENGFDRRLIEGNI